MNTMKKLAISAFAASVLLLAGCHKSSAVRNGDAAIQVTDWGVVEVAASTPTHLQLEGKDCTLTATPLADGKFAVVIERDLGVTDTNSPPGLPPGTLIHTTQTQNMIVPGNVACTCSVGQKPVRFTLKLKTS
jgi:hypothetical protein